MYRTETDFWVLTLYSTTLLSYLLVLTEFLFVYPEWWSDWSPRSHGLWCPLQSSVLCTGRAHWMFSVQWGQDSFWLVAHTDMNVSLVCAIHVGQICLLLRSHFYFIKGASLRTAIAAVVGIGRLARNLFVANERNWIWTKGSRKGQGWSWGLKHQEDSCSYCLSWLFWASACLLELAFQVAEPLWLQLESHLFIVPRPERKGPLPSAQASIDFDWLYLGHVTIPEPILVTEGWDFMIGPSWIRYPPLGMCWKHASERHGLRKHLPADAVLGTSFNKLFLLSSFSPLFPYIHIFIKLTSGARVSLYLMVASEHS